MTESNKPIKSISNIAGIVAAATLISKVFGLVRQVALAAAFGPSSAFLTNSYTYDQNGRRAERINRMGLLGENRTTFHFDDHDNPIEQISEYTSTESPHKQHTRSVYKFDAEENWMEREAWVILEPSNDFQRSNIHRRQITYYHSR